MIDDDTVTRQACRARRTAFVHHHRPEVRDTSVTGDFREEILVRETNLFRLPAEGYMKASASALCDNLSVEGAVGRRSGIRSL